MIKLLTASLGISMSLIACASVGTTKMGLLNEAVVQADQRRTEELAQLRAELKLADGSSVNNCTDYLSRSASVNVDESSEARLAKSEYLICETLDLIERSRPAAVIEANYGRRLADTLDLRSFPSSLNMRSGDIAHTLSTVATESLTIDSVSVTMDESDWHYRVEVVAIRDINGNETPDWIVWLADEAKQGSYRGYATLVVVDPEPGKGLAATPCAARCQQLDVSHDAVSQ